MTALMILTLQALILFSTSTYSVKSYAASEGAIPHYSVEHSEDICRDFLRHTPKHTDPALCHRQAIEWTKAVAPTKGASFFAYVNSNFDSQFPPEYRPSNECRVFFINLYSESQRGDLWVSDALFANEQESGSLNRIYLNYQACADEVN